MQSKNDNTLLVMQNIDKSFPGVHALKKVDFSLEKGEVCAILGENGAGKSTLMNILGGVYLPDSGTIELEGKSVSFRNAKEAEDHGIAFIHQELSLFPQMDIASNIYIQNLPHRGKLVDRKKMNIDTTQVLKKVKLEKHKPSDLVCDLKIGEQQLVEIGRTLTRGIKVLILDEPTSSLSNAEIETLFGIVRELKSHGTSVIFITHRMDEIYEICDTLMIMRDGSRVIKCGIHDISRADVVKNMLGHTAEEQYSHPERKYGKEVLCVRGMTRKGKLHNINLTVRSGELVGLYGLLGSGRTEVLRSIFGLDMFQSGGIFYLGKKVNINNPREAIDLGIAMVTEDRHKEGLVLDKSVGFNMTLANINAIRSKGLINRHKEKLLSERGIKALNIKTPSSDRSVQFLSGGNQQKVVLAKWLGTNPKLILLDEPTRGIDIGAKQEIYSIIENLLSKGVAVLMVSSEVPELLGVCDRIVVLRNGEIAGEFVNDNLQASTLLEAAMGGA